MGCLGCGCLVLALLAILFFGFIGAACYMGYNKVLAFTTTAPVSVPSSNSTDDVYQAARQKLADFDHDVKNHQAATIQLSGDEINALISHNPDIAKNNIQVFVSLTDNEARMQANFPTGTLSHGLIPGRYINFDTSFQVHFDSTTKSINLTFDTLKFGGKVLLGSEAGSDQNASSSAFNESFMRSFTPAFNQSFNNGIRKSPDGAALLDEAKSIEIKDGQLVISTQ